MAKTLKRIPSDIVSYVRIEGEAVRDANDKQMTVSYAQGKIDTIDWYLDLLDAGSEKYIVPQSRAQLVSIRQQLLSAMQTIMNTPIPKAGRPIIDIKYPKGYEG